MVCSQTCRARGGARHSLLHLARAQKPAPDHANHRTHTDITYKTSQAIIMSNPFEGKVIECKAVSPLLPPPPPSSPFFYCSMQHASPHAAHIHTM